MSNVKNEGTKEEMSEVFKQVSKTMDDFRDQANKGMLAREYQESRDVIKICAGCGGIIHGKEYWCKAEYTTLDGVKKEQGTNSRQNGETNLR